jgi:hypothetical protein
MKQYHNPCFSSQDLVSRVLIILYLFGSVDSPSIYLRIMTLDNQRYMLWNT